MPTYISSAYRGIKVVVSCVLCLLCAVMCSVPGSVDKSRAQKDVSVDVSVPALSPEMARKAEESIAVVAQGDPDAAAKALVALVPDGTALLQHHDALLRAAENAQGQMKLDVLREACPRYHRWHAELEITDPARSVAILQWMGQKVWETPKGPLKEQVARRFVADVDQWIEAGRVKADPGLRLAYHSIMLPEYVRPAVSMIPLLGLLKKHAARHNSAAFTALLEVKGPPPYCEDVDSRQIHDFLLLHYPDQQPLLDTSEHASYGSFHAIPLTWEEYEQLPTQTLESIRDQLSDCWCGSSERLSRMQYCYWVTYYLVSEFDTRPEEVKDILKALLTEKRLAPRILAGILILSTTPNPLKDDQPVPSGYVERKAGLFDVWLEHLEGQTQAKERVGVSEAIMCAKICLRFLSRIPLDNRTAAIRRLEKRSVELLLNLGPARKELATQGDSRLNYGEVPYGVLVESEIKLSPEMKEYLRERLTVLQVDPQFMQGYSESEQYGLSRALKVLTAPPA